MYLNVCLSSSNADQCNLIRSKLFPGSDPKTLKDSYVLGECIRLFYQNVDPTQYSNELLRFREYDDNNTTARNISIRAEDHAALKEIANAIGRPVAETFRLIILSYTKAAEKSKSSEFLDVVQIKALIRDLQSQINACNNTLATLQSLIEAIEKN